jgi:hypothetical protein
MVCIVVFISTRADRRHTDYSENRSFCYDPHNACGFYQPENAIITLLLSCHSMIAVGLSSNRHATPPNLATDKMVC